MSSPSQQSRSTNSVAIIADHWAGDLLAYHLQKSGQAATLYTSSKGPEGFSLPIYRGNGEIYTRAHMSFGEEKTALMWQWSERNFETARSLFQGHGVDHKESELTWYAKDSKEKGLFEGSLHFHTQMKVQKDNARLGQVNFESSYGEPMLTFSAGSLMEKLGRERVTNPIEQLEKAEDFRYLVTSGGETKEFSAVVFVGSKDLSLLPHLRETLIPVTIPSFSYSAAQANEASLFNGGLDYLFPDPAGVRLGSFRSLFSDSAVGIVTEKDPKIFSAIQDYFSKLEKLPEGEPEWQFSVENVSCDGLPVVGSFSEWPGAYVIGGFAARGQNFLFAVLEQFSRGLLGEGDFSALSLFSSKRFV